jgi:hypothetical protein
MPLSKSLKVYVTERGKRRNIKDLNAEELFATEAHQIKFYSEKSQKYQNILFDESDAYKPDNETAKSPSCLRMYNQHRKIWSNWAIDDLLPRGFSLWEGLYNDQQCTKTWKQPVLLKFLDPNKLHNLMVPVLRFDRSDFAQKYEAYTSSLSMQKKVHFNTPLQPFMVQTIKIPSQSYEDLKAGVDAKEKCITINCPADMSDYVEVPVGFTVFDGCTNAITIKFPWLRVPEDTHDLDLPSSQSFTFTFTKLPRELMDFFRSLPILYAENADYQIDIFKRFLHDLYDVDSKMKAVDLGAFAIAAGCRMDCLDLFSLSIVAAEMLFPPDLDNMDQRWAWAEDEQPRILHNYLEIKAKTLHEIYQVMMGSLLRNMFPDPDIVLFGLRMSQFSFTSWFCQFIAEALLGSRIHPDPDNEPNHFEMKTRADMIQSIKVGHNLLLDQLTDLYINVPVPACGGERYLHHARNSFFNQFAVLEKINLKYFIGEQPRPRRDVHDKKLELMYNREYVVDDSGAPTSSFDLLASPQFADTVYTLEVDIATKHKLKKPEGQHGRPVSPALCEWSRLNVFSLHSFFAKINQLSPDDLGEFWVERIRIYDYARGILTRVLDENARVRTLDLVLANREDNVRKQLERSALKESTNSITNNRRLDVLNDKTQSTVDERNALQQAVFSELPGNNTEENMVKDRARRKRMQEYARKNPEALSVREYRKQKKLRGLEKTKDIVDECRTVKRGKDSVSSKSRNSPDRIVTDHTSKRASTSGSKRQVVKFRSSDKDINEGFSEQPKDGSRHSRDRSRHVDSRRHSRDDSNQSRSSHRYSRQSSDQSRNSRRSSHSDRSYERADSRSSNAPSKRTRSRRSRSRSQSPKRQSRLPGRDLRHRIDNRY